MYYSLLLFSTLINFLGHCSNIQDLLLVLCSRSLLVVCKNQASVGHVKDKYPTCNTSLQTLFPFGWGPVNKHESHYILELWRLGLSGRMRQTDSVHDMIASDGYLLPLELWKEGKSKPNIWKSVQQLPSLQYCP